MVTRMNSLLSHVGQGTKAARGKQKAMTIQVRYLRDIFGEKEYVAPKDGGGSRFITLDVPNPTFQDLLNRSFDVYFIDGENFYGERKENVNVKMLDITERAVVPHVKVFDYLQKRGLYPSKTFFIFQTTPITKDAPVDTKAEPVDIKDEPVDSKHEDYTPKIEVVSIDNESIPLKSPLKRKTCHVCSKTHLLRA